MLASAAAPAQSYPSRAVRIIVPFTPGGSTDLYARTLSPRLAESFGQQVVVDNRAGAGGAVGAELAAKATPDGYTIWIAGIDMTHVPYKGASPAMLDLQGGRITLLATSIGSSAGLIKQGRIRALATTGTRRAPALPDVPTAAEQGVKGFDVTTWHAMLAPAKVPAPIIETLNRVIVSALKSPDVQDKITSEGGEVTPTTPGEAAAFMCSEVEKWAKLLKDASIPVE